MIGDAPLLDDRTFQDLVNEAKGYVQRKNPGWTDHNVSDPGVTLIETFAYMVEALLVRMNRLPRRVYHEMLELVGETRRAPAAAAAPLTFWLAGAQPRDVVVPRGTIVSTDRRRGDASVEFSTSEPLVMRSCTLQHCGTQADHRVDAVTLTTDSLTSATGVVGRGRGFATFAASPVEGNALVVGLSTAVPGCIVGLEMVCEQADGAGVDPDEPPLVWEARCGGEWRRCELVGRDESLGLNQAGLVRLWVPGGHTATELGGRTAGWLRARVEYRAGDTRRYKESPVVTGLSAATLGGRVEAVNARFVEHERLGESDGVTAAQRFDLAHRPVVAGLGVSIETSLGGGARRPWECVPDFGGCEPTDTVVTVDAVAGTVSFGPRVREATGEVRAHGAVPAQGATVWASYHWGGGLAGNVAAGELTSLHSAIPLVRAVENHEAAVGGVDAEGTDEVYARGPVMLRTARRAVTRDDFADLTRLLVPRIERVEVETVAPPADGAAALPGVRLLVVPKVQSPVGTLERFAELALPEDMRLHAEHELAKLAMIGTAPPLVVTPTYQGVTVVARVRARAGARPEAVEAAVALRLATFLDPLVGGRDGTGWPFGRPVRQREIEAEVGLVPGVDEVEQVQLFRADPLTRRRSDSADGDGTIEVPAGTLVYPFSNKVRVDESRSRG